MSRCIIICPLYRGECLSEVTPQPGDLLLCADAGFRYAVDAGLTPSLTIGDFDTMPQQDVYGQKRILPAHKDDTDLALCIREGQHQGYHEFLLCGCLGGRMDHTYAVFQLMAACAMQGDTITAIDRTNRIRMLKPGHYRFPAIAGCKLSLLAYSDRVTGVTVKGTEWELDNAELCNTVPLGISNEFKSMEATLSFETGIMMVTFSRDR